MGLLTCGSPGYIITANEEEKAGQEIWATGYQPSKSVIENVEDIGTMPLVLAALVIFTMPLFTSSPL